ncbi:DAPG hydrolase family protein [Thermodesulfobacteriota bacterium]
MDFADSNQLLDPGYMPLETGYYRLSNDQMHVAVLTRMPVCKGKMIDWWFGYLDGTDTYRMWHPQSHRALHWDENWSPGNYIGASHIIELEMDGLVMQFRIHFHEPSDFIDTSRFEEAKVETAICANAYNLEKIPKGRVIHLARDTDFGCEMRSRFWLFEASEIEAMRMMRHFIAETGRLADFLPGIYAMEKGVE